MKLALRKRIVVFAALVLLGAGLVAGLALAALGPVHVLSFSAIPNANGLHPSYSAAGPTAGDLLIAGNDFSSGNVVKAVNASTGRLDPGLGSGGVLPLPGGYPSSGTVEGVTLVNNTIYGTFYDFAAQTIYLVSWNAQGHLNSGFGSGGLVAIPSPASSERFLPDGFYSVLIGGRLIVAALAGAGEVTLTPVDAMTGAVAATTTSPLLSGLNLNGLRAVQGGPDGNLYALGSGTAGSASQVYYGIFNPSTLGAIGQTAFADGPNASGEALAFLGSTAYLGVTSGTGSAASAHLWSAPAGSTSTLSGPVVVPVQVVGASQSFIALTPGPSGLLYATVLDQTQNSDGSYVLETDGSSFGPGLLIGPNTVATTASPDPGDDAVAGYTATVSNGHSSYTGGFLGVAGPGGTACTPVIKVLKTVEPFSNPEQVKELPPRSGIYWVAWGSRKLFKKSPTIVFVIYVANESNCNATNVTMTDSFESHDFSFRSGSLLVGGPASVSTPNSANRSTLTVTIPSLPAGDVLEYRIVANVNHLHETSVNTATVTGGVHSTAYVEGQIAPVVTSMKPGSTQVQGSAGNGSAIHQVWVAIESLFSGASDARAHCLWLSNTKAKFKALPCNRVIWLHAAGTKHWRLVFKRPLPRGRYLVFAIALGKRGLSADTLTRGAGDTKIFRVR